MFDYFKIGAITSVEDARQTAIDWQNYASENNLDMQELADAGEYFTYLANKFGLTAEFKENGII